MFILLGPTRTGKTTFLESIQTAFEPYSMYQNEDFLTETQNNNTIMTTKAQMHGKRLLYISEIYNRIKQTNLKLLTGERNITARKLYCNTSMNFKHTITAWIGTNNMDFDKFDESVKSKIRVIKFDKRFYRMNLTEEHNKAVETGRVLDPNVKYKLFFVVPVPLL
jgi:putative DNA primase/helicase